MTPMQLGTDAELQLVSSSLTVGIFMGVIYDLFRIIRKCTDNKVVTYVCDFIFALMFGTVFFIYSLFRTNYVRGFIFALMLAGTVMWCATAGRLIVFVVCKALRLAFKVFIYPPIGFIHKFCRLSSDLFVEICRKIKNSKKIRKTS